MLSKYHTLRYFSYAIRSPLDLQLFREEQKLKIVKESLKKRYRDQQLAQKINSMVNDHKSSLYSLEQLNKQINSTQKQIKSVITNKNNKDSQILKQLKEKMANLKKQQKNQENCVNDLAIIIEKEIMKVGNIINSITPVSDSQLHNQVLRTYSPTQNLKQHSPPYSQICERAKITDLSRGQKVSGHRGYFLKSNGLKLALALTQYAIDFMENKGYQLYQSPAIISQDALKASCQLQSIAEDVYKLQNTDKSSPPSYLIATSEQTLAGYYKNQVLQKQQLPIKMCGYSTCFRKQAGAHGKDIHGLFRVHQFEKVEQFAISEQNKSQQQMERMIKISQQFYKSLEIPYRVVNIVSGELNDAASCKYDLEAWYPSQKRYRELVSVSNCTDYQSRLLKVQYLGPNNQLRYPHMLNGTLIAIQRTITCLIQNYYTPQYLKIPKTLQNYLKTDKIMIK